MSARFVLGTAGSVAVLLVLAIASLFVGVGSVTAGAAEAWHLILVSRLPRTLAAILVGAGLAIAGIVMQALARNRFVEPTTAGTAQSAALGILLVTLAWPEASIALKAVVATLVAIAGTSLFLAASTRLPPTEPFLVPLVGIVYGGVLGAAATYLAWQADLMQFLDVWTSGDLSGVVRGRYELLWVLAALVALAWFAADSLTILALGEGTSRSLGVSYRAMLQFGLAIVSGMSAVSVVVIGVVPFVGLVVPALVSRLCGDNLRGAIPVAAVGGAILVLGSDIAGRLVRHPYEVPVGTMLGVVGAVAFLAIVSRSRAHD